MAMTYEKLDQELRVLGDRLSNPPSVADELITLLDQIEKILSQVEQSPKGPLNVSTSVVLKGLVTDKIFRNSDADVQVAVASCLSQIIRITAPDAPYNDEEMKEILQLIVSTFEKLDDKSSRSYDKRIAILESTAKIRSSVVMLDLECDLLVVKMINHFFRTLRDYHPESVLSSMTSIITLVLEESEDIPPQLLSPVLACLRPDNKGALPIAQKLAENVLQKCGIKVKPYLVKAVETLGISLDDYSPVVMSMCRDKCSDVEPDQNPTNETVIDEVIPAETTPADADMLNDKSPKSEISNDVTQAGKDEILVDSASTKSKEDKGKTDVPKDADGLSNAETNSLGTEGTELDKTSLAAGDEAAETLPVEEGHGKDLLGSTNENPSAGLVVASENGKETNTEDEQAASPVKEVKQSADDNPETPELETESATLGDVGEEENGLPADSEAKPQKRFRRSVERYTDSGSLRWRKKLNRRRASSGKDSPKTSARNDGTKMVTSPKSTSEVGKDEHDSEATPDASSKRKRTPAKEKTATSSGKDKNGENLVGSKIRVWWPKDQRFYQGVVDSYDSSRRKHRVLYDDGDVEHLYMRKEKWEFVKDDAEADENDADSEASSDATPEPLEKKAKSNGKESSKKGDKSDKSTKKGKASSSAERKSKTNSGKKSKDAEKKVEKPKEGDEEAVKSKEAETPKSTNKSTDKTPNIGGKIVAATLRLKGKSKTGEEPEDDDQKTPKSSKSANKTSEKKKSRLSSSKATKKSTTAYDKHDDDSSSDDESKPLASFIKKLPASGKNLKVKVKVKGAAEGSSGTKRKR